MNARGLAITVFALACAGCARPIYLLTYNAFNLFDSVDDGTEYREYDPGGGRWNARLYERRLAAVATVIRRSCPGGPDILALQELENRSVLDALCERHLSGYRYRVVPDAPLGGVRCAIASRLPIRRAGTLDAGDWNGVKTRLVLEVVVDCRGAPLSLLVVHWKSKTEGVAETRAARDAAAAAVASRLSSLLAERPDRDVVVAGDFNENVDELHAGVGRRVQAGRLAVGLIGVDSPDRARADDGLVSLYDPWNELTRANRGSAPYRGAWETPDHMLLSAGLFDRSGLVYRRGSFRAVKHSFMLDPGTGFPLRDRELGWRYSDHLPLLAELERVPDRGR